MEALEGVSPMFWVFFAVWVIVFLGCIDVLANTFFSDILNPGEGYMDGEVQELSGFIRADGVDIPPVQAVVSEDEYPIADSLGYRSYAWTSSFGNYGVVWAHTGHTNSYYILAHEMAHQVIFKKYPDFEGDQHDFLEFRQWEACLTASSKFHSNLCGMMK